jgi:hypothetical protein
MQFSEHDDARPETQCCALEALFREENSPRRVRASGAGPRVQGVGYWALARIQSKPEARATHRCLMKTIIFGGD